MALGGRKVEGGKVNAGQHYELQYEDRKIGVKSPRVKKAKKASEPGKPEEIEKNKE